MRLIVSGWLINILFRIEIGNTNFQICLCISFSFNIIIGAKSCCSTSR